MKIVAAEWPCAAGKSVVIAVYALFLHSQDPTKKIVICVPNSLLACLMQLDCKGGLSSDTKGLHEVGPSGIYVCTHSVLLDLSDEVLSESFVEVDELHELLKIGDAIEKLCKAKQVFALSATLGGRIGKERLERMLTNECKILDTAE